MTPPEEYPPLHLHHHLKDKSFGPAMAPLAISVGLIIDDVMDRDPVSVAYA